LGAGGIERLFWRFGASLLMQERCGLCGGVLPPHRSVRCFRCGKLFCEGCITEDFPGAPGGSGHLICLGCARRFVSPRRAGGTYDSLGRYLAYRARYVAVVTLPFARIEGIIRDNLPLSAFRDREWWTSRGGGLARALSGVGWTVYGVDMDEKRVTFRRPEGPLRTRRKPRQRRKPVAVVPYRPRRIPRPSKTRVAMALARLRNVEQRRASPRQYRGRLKPRSAYEKRQYKPEAKPSRVDE